MGPVLLSGPDGAGIAPPAKPVHLLPAVAFRTPPGRARTPDRFGTFKAPHSVRVALCYLGAGRAGKRAPPARPLTPVEESASCATRSSPLTIRGRQEC